MEENAIENRILTILVILILVTSGLASVLVHGEWDQNSKEANPINNDSVKKGTSKKEKKSISETDQDNQLEKTNSDKDSWKTKVSDSLLKKTWDKRQESKRFTTLTVATTNLGQVNRILKTTGGTPHLSSDTSTSEFDYSRLEYDTGEEERVSYRTLDVPASAVEGLAKLPGVKKIFKKPEIKPMGSENDLPKTVLKKDFTTRTGSDGRGFEINKDPGEQTIESKAAGRAHHAAEAWENGYDGSGVNIGIVDTGTDFAHADLVNQWATAGDGNYSGWPIMLNPESMEQYLSTGYPVGDRSGSSSAYSQTNFTFSQTNSAMIENETVVRTEETEVVGNVSDLRGDGIYSSPPASIYHWRMVNGEKAFDGPNSTGDVYNVNYLPEYNFTGNETVYNHGQIDKENAFTGPNSTGDTYDLRKHDLTTADVYYTNSSGNTVLWSNEENEDNYTLDKTNGTIELNTDIPSGSYVNVTYEWEYVWDTSNYTFDTSTGDLTLNTDIDSDTMISIDYTCWKEWTEGSEYTLHPAEGAIEFNQAVDTGEKVTATYKCGQDLTLLNVTVPKARYPSNDTWGQKNLWAPYNITDLPNGITSQSGTYKFGVSKSKHLNDLWGERVGILLVDSQTPGEYDTVFVDIDHDYDFGDEKPVNKSSPLAFTEVKDYTGGTSESDLRDINNYEFDWMGNSAEDAEIALSAGLLYWITDGEHSIPYADRYADLTGYDSPPVPGDGNLTAFYHDWGDHGTSTASNAAGSGLSAEKNEGKLSSWGLRFPSSYTAKGTAPGAKVIGVSALQGGSMETSWRFVSEGYDGEPDTGDEADISSNSWGTPGAENSGWSMYDRMAMTISDEYPNTTIIASAGNEGNGYGTVSAPGSSPGVIGVGGGTLMAYRSIYYLQNQFRQDQYDKDPRGQWPAGDVIPMSSRGPNSMGQPGVDVLAAGAFAQSAFPVNHAWTYRTIGDPVIGWDFWEWISGAVGIPHPHNSTHALRLFSGTSLAAPVTAGCAALAHQAYVDHHGSSPSNEKLKKIVMNSADDHGFDPLQQGAGWINASMAVKLANETEGALSGQDFWSPGSYNGSSHRGMANMMHPGESDTLDVSLDNYGSFSGASAKRYEKAMEYSFHFDHPATGGMVNVTKKGIYDSSSNLVKDNESGKLEDILNTDGFLKIIGNQDSSSNAYLQFFNWQDNNGNKDYDSTDNQERVRMNYAQQDGYYLTSNIHNPQKRVHEGLIIKSGTSGYYTFTGNITIQAYEKTSWDWVTLSDISAGGFNANITVPDVADTGGYQGSIQYTADGYTSIIPIFVNVANDSWPVKDIGGETPQTSLYSNDRIGAHSDYYDNRYFYIDHNHSQDIIQDRNFVGFLRDLTGNSSLTMNVYGATGAGDAYGDFTMEKVTSAELSDDPTKVMVQMTEYINAHPGNPLLLEIRCTEVGKLDETYGETIDGSLGHNDMSPLTFTEYNEPTGQHEIGVETNIDIPGGLSAIAPERVNESVDDAPIDPHPYTGGSFEQYLADAPNQEKFKLSDAYMFSFEIWGNDPDDDYDLGIFLDGKNGNPEDGEAQEGEFIGYSADADANEKVELIEPNDGTYICKMAGYSVSSGLVDWEMEKYFSRDSPFGSSNVPDSTITPGSDYDISSPDASFQITWDIAAENQTGTITGKMFGSPIFSPTASMQLIEPTVVFDYKSFSPWPMFSHDLNNTGQSQYNTSHVDGTERWRFKTDDWIYASSPAIGQDGTIYIGSDDNNMYAINPNGTEKWNFTTGDAVQSSPAIGTDGTIYFGSKDYNLYAINPNGTEKWNYSTGGQVWSSPAIGSNGTIYVGSGDSNLYAINPNGTEKWSVNIGDATDSSPAIGSDGTIYIGSWDHNLYAINPNGTEKWNYSTGDWVRSSPAIGPDGTIYFGSEDYNMYALYPNGTEKWRFNTGMEVRSSPAIGKDGTVYVGSRDNNLYAVNPNGTEKWNFVTGDNIYVSSPSIGADGTIYVGSSDNHLYAVNPDGTEKWKFSANNRVQSAPAIGSDGTIYVGSRDNNLYAVTGGYDIELTAGGSSEGWNFISTPYIPDNKDLLSILDDPLTGISGNYDRVMYYNTSQDEWRTFVSGRADRYNNLEEWDRRRGIWVHMTANDTLAVTGKPPSTTNITLHPGWNMVGYPSETNRIASNVLPSEVSKIGVFNKYAEYNIEYVSDLSTEVLVTGRGYWLYNDADHTIEWTVGY